MPVYIGFSALVDQNSSQQLIAACAAQANAGIDEIVLVLSTPGGGVDQGIMIYNVLKALPVKLTTVNVGVVNSIGNAIFLAGENRYAVPGATFLFHGVGLDIAGKVRLEEKNLTENLEVIRIGQKKIGEIICSRTSIDAQEANELFFRQEIKGTDFARDKGIIHDIRPLVVPRGAPFLQLVFQNQGM